MMNVQNIDCKTLKKWLDNDEAILIDVREPAEHQTQNIKGAALLPLGKVCCAQLPDTNKKIVIHCLKGARGGAACEKLIAENEGLEIYNLEGGIAAWKEAGLPTEEKGRKVIPLDRQVQITAGLLVFVTSLLGYFVNINFTLVAVLLGGGLVFAGVSGICTMAKLLAKMPWNK